MKLWRCHSGSGTSAGSVAFIRQDHSHALQPISSEERGPRPSAADAESAESVLLDSDGRPVWLASSSQDESPFPGIQVDRRRRPKPYKGEANPLLAGHLCHQAKQMLCSMANAVINISKIHLAF